MNEKTVKQYKVVQFEPDPFYQINVELLLNSIGLGVAATAATADEARKMVSDIEKKTMQPDVVIISNYLARDWEDGMRIAQRIKAAQPAAKIISYSVVRDQQPWADAYAVKSGLDNEHTILKAIASVLNIEIQVQSDVDDTY
jgi:DNA-binding NarL/FixJ family response regulator